MTDPSQGGRESLKALVLAGVLWGCMWHLAAAQRKVSLILDPAEPEEGHDVTIVVQGGSQNFVRCEWRWQPHNGGKETILKYVPDQSPQQRNSTSHTGRKTASADCSLHIANLRLSDTGNYSISFTVETNQQSGQQRHEFYDGSVYLQVSASDRIIVSIRSEPQRPIQGELVTLTPRQTPPRIDFCEWIKVGPSGNSQTILHSPLPEQQAPQRDDERVTIGPGCSLLIKELTTADSGNYTVRMEYHSDGQQQQPGQEPEESPEYWGVIELQVDQTSSNRDHQKAKAAGLGHCAGIVAGALLVSFTWTSTFPSLFRGLC
ncbi:uncharacterized protein LOC143837144 [Paroedura picta]|uniref:uncharacterized protein LOC143837144 n=1 Tax=Paroedura picta TaxID=143630 RepID=UPI004056E8F6